MNKYYAGLIAAFGAAITGFIIHVASQEWVQAWVSSRMDGHAIASSWDVRYIALITSLETGLGLSILYALIRKALPAKSSLVRGLLLGVLLLAVMGRLFRQPIMNLIVGNPLSVVIVQDGAAWIAWIAMSVIIAVSYDFLISINARETHA